VAFLRQHIVNRFMNTSIDSTLVSHMSILVLLAENRVRCVTKLASSALELAAFKAISQMLGTHSKMRWTDTIAQRGEI